MDYTDFYTETIKETRNDKVHIIFGVQNRRNKEVFVAVVKKISPAPDDFICKELTPEVEDDVEEFESASYFETLAKYKDFLCQY